MREVNAPPRSVFRSRIGSSYGLARGSVRKPAKIMDCGEPGRSTMYTSGLLFSDTVAMFFFGTSPPFQLLNSFSSLG